MHHLAFVLQIISMSLMGLTAPVFLWQFVVGAFGLLPYKKKKPVEHKYHRFAIVICARNERNVIGCLIDSLTAQQYPREQFDIVVAADNCTDDTADVARQHGAIVYERFDHRHVGKGFALRWLFEQIERDYPSVYDAVTVFDADNLAAPQFLWQTNEALCAGADAVKGYRQVKNCGDSWVSDCYAIYWESMMRFFHRARANCGLSCFVDGTGFSFKMDLIRDTGWDTHSMVEDCEFSMHQILKGHHIVPVYDAVYYDEQPVTFSLSLRQRFRWTVGCVQCIKYCLPAAWQALCAKREGRGSQRATRMAALDVILYLLLIPAVAVSVIGGFASIAAYLVNPHMPDLYVGLSMASLLWGWFSLSGGALLVLLLEKRAVRPLWRSIVLFPLFIFSMAYMAVIAVFCPQTAWKPIAHTCKTNISDLSKKSIAPPAE